MLNQFSDAMILNEIPLIVVCSVSESYYSFTLEFNFSARCSAFLYTRYHVKQSRCNKGGSEQLGRNELVGDENVSAEETTFSSKCR